MGELSFHIDRLAIIVWASLLLVKFLILPLIEKYFLDDVSDASANKFKFWSTLLSWLPVFWLWFYILGQTITFSNGLIIWTSVGVAAAGLLGSFNSSPDKALSKEIAPKKNLFWALSAQICFIIIIYMCLRFVGVVPYVYGGIFLAILAVMLVLSATRSEFVSKQESESSEVSPSDTIKSSTVEKFAYSFATGLTVSSPIQSSSSYISPIGTGGFVPSYSSGPDAEEFFGCLLALVGIPVLVALFIANIILLVPVIVLQMAIFILMIILIIPLFIPSIILKDYLKIAIGLTYIALLPNLIADENLYSIATWVGLPILFGLPFLVLYIKLISRAPFSAILAVVSVIWGFLILLSASIFLLSINDIRIIVVLGVVSAIILTIIGLKRGLKVSQLLLSIMILGLVGLEAIPRVECKRLLRQAEDAIKSGQIRDGKIFLEAANGLITKYADFTEARRLPGIFRIVPSLQSIKADILMAKAYMHECEYSKAIKYLQDVQASRGEYLSKNAEINVAMLQAGLYGRLGDEAKQKEMENWAWEVANKTLNRPYWTALVNRYRARLQIEEGNYKEAINILKDVRKVGKRIGSYKLISRALSSLGDAYFAQGRYSEAEGWYAGALELSQKYKAKGDEALYLLKLAMAQKEPGNVERALEHLSQTANIAREISSNEVLWESLYQKGLLLQDEGKKKEALDSFLEAIAVIDTVRGGLKKEKYRLGYMANKLPVYEHAVSLASQMGSGRDAFMYAQKAKSRVFLDLLGTRMVAFRDEDRELAVKERLLQIKVNALLERVNEEESKPERLQSGNLKEWKEALQKALKEHSEIKAEINRTNPRLASLTTAPTVNLSEVQKVLHRDEVFLEYFVLDDKTLLWAVTRKGVKTFEIPVGREKLRGMVSKIYQQITRNITPSVSDLNRAYKEFLGPVSGYLKRKRHIIIAPHNKLYLLPFEALVVAKGTPTYVVDRWFVSYYPSASVLVLNRKYQDKRQMPSKPLFAVGDPVFSTNDPRYPSKDKKAIQVAMADKESGAIYRRVWMDEAVEPATQAAKTQLRLGRLNATGGEVKAISRLWGVSGKTDDIKLGMDATEKEVKKADHTQYRYEHYATHGVLRGDIPNLKEPALVFSLPNPDDPATDEGFLTMSEIFGLRTNADMVVLSACKTALGEAVPGEGLVGLTRAFMYAGTPSVVASLWSVADQSTAKLMTSYYKYLKQGKDKAEALSLAKQKLKKQGYHNPFYWAPFVLVGER